MKMASSTLLVGDSFALSMNCGVAVMPHTSQQKDTGEKTDKFPTLLIQTYYTPFFAKIQVLSTKIHFFVDSYNFYVNFIMSTGPISKQKFLSF